MDPTRILIVDNHTLFWEGIKEILEVETDLQLVGEARSVKGAIALAGRMRPHVVVIDIDIPALDPRSTLCGILDASSLSKVIVLAAHDDIRLLVDLLLLGARGFLVKGITRQELVATIRGLRSDGERIVVSVSPAIVGRLNEAARGPLSRRETDVLALAAHAMSNAQIAARLSIAEGTVKRHLRNIYVKLDASSRIDAVNRAVAAALIKPPQECGRCGA